MQVKTYAAIDIVAVEGMTKLSGGLLRGLQEARRVAADAASAAAASGECENVRR